MAVERKKSFECALGTEKAHIATAIKGGLSGGIRERGARRWWGIGGCDISSNRDVAIGIKGLHSLGNVVAADVLVNVSVFDVMGDA